MVELTDMLSCGFGLKAHHPPVLLRAITEGATFAPGAHRGGFFADGVAANFGQRLPPDRVLIDGGRAVSPRSAQGTGCRPTVRSAWEAPESIAISPAAWP
jgi:hypothetical protein